VRACRGGGRRGHLGEPEGYYHHYPAMQQVRAWLTAAGFAIQEEAEGPWHQEGYAYHHVLARVEAHHRSLSQVAVGGVAGDRRDCQPVMTR
jgi:hypothetical protein